MEQKNGHFRLSNADFEPIYDKNDDFCSIKVEKDAILVPLSELDLWLYAGELLEAQNLPETEKVPMVGNSYSKTSNDWNFSAENFQSLEKSPEKVPTIGKIEAESSNHWKKSEGDDLPELLERLAEEMAEQQAEWLPIMPPSTSLVLTVKAQPSPTLIKVSEMMDGLLCESGTCGRIYPVTAKEKDKEPKGRERRFFNKKEELLGVAECETNYNPHSWVENKFPDLDTMPEEEREWLKSVYDPKRISITYDLTLTDPALIPASVPEPIQPISRTIDGGSNHTVYARYDGTAWTWGDNSFGQLGLGETGTLYYLSRQVEMLSNIVAVAAGDKFSAWLDENGMVFIAGVDPSALQQFSNPVRLENVPAMQAVSTGPEHLLMLDRQGDVWVSGRVGIGHQVKVPFKISGIGGIREVAAGEKENLALDGQGNVYRWDTPQSGKKTPEKINGLSAITAIVAGRDHYLALTASGRIQTWGKNEFGQLGLGDHRTRKDPALIASLTNIISIAADGMHSLALDANGDGWAWGANQFGQLGAGTTNNALMPAPMNGITHAVGIAAGERHSLALQSSGITVWSVGDNSFGQLGSGYETILKQPREIDSDGDGLLDSWEYKSTGTLTTKSGSGQTAIEYLDISQSAGRVSLMLGYPDGFTNRLDIFSCTNLMESKWTLRETTNVQTLANWITWEDATDTEHRYYAAGNADYDSDADGLSDARERFVYGTSTATNDTDGDGLNDGWEVAMALDPLSAESDNGAQGDPDYDGLSNFEEWTMDANPKAFDSVIVLSPDDLYGGEKLRLAVPGRGIQYRSVTAWRSKCGFLGLIPSIPPRYFKRETYDDSGYWTYDRAEEPCIDFLSGTRSYHWDKTWDAVACELQSEIYGGDVRVDGSQNVFFPPDPTDPSAPPPEICGAVVASCTTEGHWNPDGSRTDYTESGNYLACVDPYIFPNRIGDPVETPGVLYYKRVWDGTEVDDQGWVRTDHTEVTEEVSGEYTTQELLINAMADLDGCGPLTAMEWGEGKYSRHVAPFDNMFSCKLSVSAYAAFRDLNTNENYITLAKLGYRFRAENLQTGQLYRLNWLELFTPEGGGTPVVFKTKTTVFRGTGGIQPIEDATCIIDPPAFDGEIAPLVIRLDLDVDSDYDGIITAADDPIELSAGGIVGLNQDDDNTNGIPDKDDPGAFAGEDDLEVLNLTVNLASLNSGTVILEAITGAGNVEVWESADKTAQVPLPREWTVGIDSIPTNLYVEGVNESTSLRDVEFRLRYAADGQSVDDNIRMTVVKTDLDVDADYDDDIDEGDDLLEVIDGGMLGVNLDDDNANGIPDKDDPGAVAGEDDLEAITLKLEPDALSSGTLTLEAISSGDKIRIWESAIRETEAVLPKTWVLGSDTVPATLYVEGIGASISARDVELRLIYSSGNTQCDDSIKLTVFYPRLIPDFNHDRSITELDYAQLISNGVFRFWKNDDDDFGDISEDDSDVPGQGGWFDDANYEDGKVNGRSDLLDFFPVWLDLHDTLNLLPPSGTVQYKLKQANGAVRAVYTDLTKGSAGNFLTTDGNTYGPSFNQNSFEADTFEVTSSGVALTVDFLNNIKNDATKGVLLVEGMDITTAPLILEIWISGSKICEKEMPLSISGVEDMYRTANMRGMTNPGVLSEPTNNPDALSNGKHLVFLHGYQAADEAALGVQVWHRAWLAEMFKRFHWSGSQAKFHGIVWRSDGGDEIDYQKNVTNAFCTAPVLSDYVAGLNGDVVVVAHSLGNMVVSSAIADHAMSVSQYMLCDAAVASEAYDVTITQEVNLVNVWWADYSNHTWAANWCQLFDGTGDSRENLTWRDRFADVINATEVWNFRSSGDEVFNLADNPGLLDGAIEIGYWGIIPISVNINFGRYSWQKQELFKGIRYSDGWASFGGTAEAGWGFESAVQTQTVGDEEQFSVIPIYTNAVGANAASTNDLRTNPVFKHSPDWLVGTNALSQSQIDFMLGMGIPALTPATGETQLPVYVIPLDHQKELNSAPNMGFKPNGWPNRGDPDFQNWLHNDMKAVAYLYNYVLFDTIVNAGGLK
ncbi:MAG: hypothetical protein AB7T27_01920 [Kiritimatiellia bacterium]